MWVPPCEAVTSWNHADADFNELTPKVLTVHSAKGLTFDSVVLPRVTAEDFGWFDDPRRLLFVASTRALEGSTEEAQFEAARTA